MFECVPLREVFYRIVEVGVFFEENDGRQAVDFAITVVVVPIAVIKEAFVGIAVRGLAEIAALARKV